MGHGAWRIAKREAPNSKHLPSPERLRAGRPNNKQIQMTQIQNSKQNRFSDLKLRVGVYLGFEIWNFGFQTLCAKRFALCVI
jgi:hypothetical protein